MSKYFKIEGDLISRTKVNQTFKITIINNFLKNNFKRKKLFTWFLSHDIVNSLDFTNLF